MTAADTYLLLRALCDELARSGVTDACTSPGSRNTPLVLSLAREPRIRCWSQIDERCAGFFALGAAKASGRPVPVTCTSGTAVANLVPAVIEAWHARVPLIVLSADRPPELRDVGAGQTIDQLKLFGDSAKWFFEVGVHDATAERLRWIRALACRAVLVATGGRPGPVHLNFPLREPLLLDGPLPEDPVPGRGDGRPWITSQRASQAVPDDPRHLLGGGIVVAGRHERVDGQGAAVARFAANAGYPLFADPLSGARHGEAAIARYDMLLRSPRLTAKLRPNLVIRIGDLPTSKPLRTWLASLPAGTRQVLFDPEDAWQDPAAVVSERYVGDVAEALRAWTPEQPIAPTWLARWRAADAAAGGAVTHALADGLSEPNVAAGLSRWLPPEATLFVASSMPIRDLELFSQPRTTAPRVLCNRGANGIDGTVSSAFGVAASSSGPVVLLIGDVALAHDVGGLLAARRLGLSLTIVVLNNDGGGIFHFLPVAAESDAFEEHVATPHGLEFSAVADLYGCLYVRPDSPAALRAAVERSMAGEGTTIIEVRTDRVQNRELHRRIEETALAAVESVVELA